MQHGFVKVAAGTPSVRVADCIYNGEQTARMVLDVAQQGVKILVLPELGLTGYTCGDLFLQKTLLQGAVTALQSLLKQTAHTEVLFFAGFPAAVGGALYNCAAVCQRGRILAVIPKTHIPNYGEFSEKRWFAPAPGQNGTITLCGQTVPFGTQLVLRCSRLPELTVGVELCEDLWAPQSPAVRLAAAGATVICNLSATNESVGKAAYRQDLVKQQSARLCCAYIHASCGDGESTTDLVFGGHDLIAENGTLLAEQRFTAGYIATEIDVQKLEQERRRTHMFTPCTMETVEFDLTLEETLLTRPVSPAPFIPQDPAQRDAVCEEILTVAALGLKRRLEHTGSKTAVIGLSGGLDSTLALLIVLKAFDLLGRDRKDILAVTMPCFGTTDRTRSNAEILARCSGCSFRTVSIGDTVRSHFADIGQSMDCHDVTFENGQARERTQVLMDLANMTGGMVIGTGDLSELALGWATYNGDQMSMYGVNGAIPKTLVRHLVDYAAAHAADRELSRVLLDILDTPVSPELLPAVDGKIAQKTEDLVGPYDLHDFFLYYMIRWACPPAKILRMATYAFHGRFDRETILKWLKTFCRRFFAQQFKRSCLPDGPKVGSVTLSPRGDWQMPSDAVWSLWRQELENL